MTSSAIIELGY